MFLHTLNPLLKLVLVTGGKFNLANVVIIVTTNNTGDEDVQQVCIFKGKYYYEFKCLSCRWN